MIDPKRFEKLRGGSDDPNAYASLQPGLHYFDHELGYIAYRKAVSGHVVLGDPVTSPQHLVEFLKAYLKTHPNSVFNYVSETTANALLQASKKQMHFIHIFYDRIIELPYDAEHSRPVLGALKKARKARLRLVEKDLSVIDSGELEQLKKINDFFIEDSHAKREVGFISRTMSFHKEPDVRLFAIYTHDAASPIGFCTLDPWYRDEKLAGYQLNQFRLGPTKLWGLYLSVVAMLSDILHTEGVEKLCLGGCVDFHNPPLSDMPASKLYSMCRKPAIRMADKYYGLANFSRNKFEFAGSNVNRYIAAPHRLPFLPLLMVTRAFKD